MSNPKRHFTFPAMAPISSALATGKYSDLIIKCRDMVLKVHRVIVCSSCTYFASVVDSCLIESTNGVIDLSFEEPDIVSKMIQFLYTFSYDGTDYKKIRSQSSEENSSKKSESPNMSSVLKGPEALVIHIKVYLLAKKYGVAALKAFASRRYNEIVWENFDNPFFAQSISLVFNNSMPMKSDLACIMVDVAVDKQAVLLSRTGFKKLLLECGEFHVNFLAWNDRVKEMPQQEEAPGFHLQCADRECSRWYICLECHESTEFVKDSACNKWKLCASECVDCIDFAKETAKGTHVTEFECVCFPCSYTFQLKDIVCQSCGGRDFQPVEA